MAAKISQKDKTALVIVESPAKAKTINKYLGSNYLVKASMGHVRDLPQEVIGVDIDKNFAPTYEILGSRKKLVGELKAAAKQSREVFLATDLDREGEAIAWHLTHAWAWKTMPSNASCLMKSPKPPSSKLLNIHTPLTSIKLTRNSTAHSGSAGWL